VPLGNGDTDRIADTLAKRASGDLNAGSVVGLGMAGGDAVDSLRAQCQNPSHIEGKRQRGTYPERLQVVHRDGIAVKVEQGILEHAAVAVARRPC
jgi:hypothetical protein